MVNYSLHQETTGAIAQASLWYLGGEQCGVALI